MINCLGGGPVILEVENVEHFPTLSPQLIDLAGKFRVAAKLPGIMRQSKMLPFHSGLGLVGRWGVGDFVLCFGRQEDESESEGKNGDEGYR